MKIFLIGSQFHRYTDALAEAFETEGHEVCKCILKDTWSYSTKGKLYSKGFDIYKRIIRKPNEIYKQPMFLRRQVSEIAYIEYEKFKPDLVVNFAGYMLTPEVISRMKDCITVLWIFDSIVNLSKIYDTLSYYDYIYTFERTDCQWFNARGLNAEFLPLCADDKIYKKIDSSLKDIDVFFIGSMTRDRTDFFRRLKKAMPNINIKVYGVYLSKFNFIGRLRRIHDREDLYLANQFLKPKEINSFYNRSKICINVHAAQTRAGGNMRLYEASAAGAFQIVDANPYIEEEFCGMVGMYHNTTELFEEIRRFLNNEEMMREYSEKAYQKVINEDLFIHRARHIIQRIEENGKKYEPISKAEKCFEEQ